MQINPYLRYAAKSRVYIDDTVAAYDCRLLYILEGEGFITVGENKFPLKKDVLVYYPAGVFYHIHGENLEFYTVNFDFTYSHSDISSALLPTYPHQFDRTKIIRSKEVENEKFSSPFYIQDAVSLKGELEQLIIEKDSKILYFESVCSGLLKLILCKTMRIFLNLHQNDEVFTKILDYIKASYSEKIDNETIARELNYHKNYLNSVVKEKTGISLHRYVTAFRISKATELLYSTHLSINEISEKCGFVNPNHFSVKFKEETGISPLNYRKRNI